MRGLLIVIIVIALMVLGGWLIFNFDDDSASVQINTDKIERDSREAMEDVGNVLHEAGEGIEAAVDR